MSTQFDNTNSGAIFKNDKKTEMQPDYKGKINVDGKDKEIALWIKTSKDGSKTFFSAKISEPYQAAEKVQENAPIQAKDDLPF
jgi:hypothetical protein